MASLYNIEQDMIALYDKIEQQGGEILPEDEEMLAINSENFMNKMSGYNSYLLNLDNDIAACKKEEDRIKLLRKKYESRKETAKNIVLKAVQTFGVRTKTGGWCCEFPTFKFSTRRSESIATDEVRMEYLSKELNRLINELHDYGMLHPHIDWDLDGLCNTINANIQAEMKADGLVSQFIPFTPTDLEMIEINIEAKTSIANAFRSETGIFKPIIYKSATKNDLSVNKTTAKNYLKVTDDVNIISCCHKEANYSLQMS